MKKLDCRSEFPYYEKDDSRVYLDSAATSLKPSSVINEIVDHLKYCTGNVHRSGTINAATTKYENARNKVANFINAKSSNEIVFTSGTTQSINMIADSEYRTKTSIISNLEHHSNILPWGKTFILKNAKSHFDLDKFESVCASQKNQLVSVCHVDNVTGTLNPIKEIIQIAHRYKCLVVVDGAQAIPHLKVDVQDLDADFYVFSGHKMYGPSGIGVLYGKSHLLENMTPQNKGGGMISGGIQGNKNYELADIPYRFEAGTPNIEGAIGLGAAIDWINSQGIDAIRDHIDVLSKYAMLNILPLLDFPILGDENSTIVSIYSDKFNITDIGHLIEAQGIAVRVGTMCASLHLQKYSIPELLRISFGPYNNKQDIDKFVDALRYSATKLK